MTRSYPVSTDFGFGIIIAVIIEVVLCFLLIIQPFVVGPLAIVVGCYIYTRTTDYRLTAIEISEVLNSITIQSKNVFGKVENEIFSLKSVYFTYRKRTVYGGFGAIPQIQTRNVCVVDCPRKTLAVLEPDVDGWTDRSILTFVQNLKASGVKRIAEKYSDNDVEI